MAPADDEQQRFAKRIEAFSDIVFGFALAQCAVALEVPHSLADAPMLVPHLVVFIITFALVAMFWSLHYRMFRWLFAAQRLDVIVNFALLADIALLPFALQLFSRFRGAPLAYGIYAAVLGLAFLFLAVLELRGFRAHADRFDQALYVRLWRTVLRHAVSGTLLIGSLPLIVRSSATPYWLFVPIAASFLTNLAPAPNLRSTDHSTVD